MGARQKYIICKIKSTREGSEQASSNTGASVVGPNYGRGGGGRGRRGGAALSTTKSYLQISRGEARGDISKHDAP